MNKKDLAPVGSPVVFFKRGDPKYKLGKIIGYRTANNVYGIEAICEKSNPGVGGWLFKTFTGRTPKTSVSLDGIYHLKDVKIIPQPTSSLSVITSKPSSNDGALRIRNRNRDLRLFAVPLREIKPNDVVVWNPDKSPNPEDSYLGEIEQTFVHQDVTNLATYYAQVKILDGMERLQRRRDLCPKFVPKYDILECRVWAVTTELMLVGDAVEAACAGSENVGELRDGENNCSNYSNQFMDSTKVEVAEEAKEQQAAIIKPDNSAFTHDNLIQLTKDAPVELMETDLDEENNNAMSDLSPFVTQNLALARSNGKHGIQGKSNSCYIDSCLFVMFSFTELFDSALFKPNVQQEGAIPKKIRQSLITIAVKLRSEFFVHWKEIAELRAALGDINGRYDAGCFMDAEELLLDIFDCLTCPDFFEFSNQATDRIHQIVVPSTENVKLNEQIIMMKDMDTLFKDSLWYCEVKLVRRPEPVLILKMPFCDGKPLFGCRAVVPGLKLQLGLNDKGKNLESMDLFAIICLKSSHYVSFAKVGREASPWVYFDSSPMDMQPKVDVLDNLDSDLIKVSQDHTVLQKNSGNTLEYREHMKLICGYCYMCFYK